MNGLPCDFQLAEIRRQLASDASESVAIQLGRLGSPMSISILEAALCDADPRIRTSAARGLRAAGRAARQAVEALVARLDDPVWAVVIETASALGHLGEHAIGALRALEGMLWTERWRCVVESDVGPQARDALGTPLGDLMDAKAAEVRQALIDAVEAVRSSHPAQ